jgi:hypothetical protein
MNFDLNSLEWRDVNKRFFIRVVVEEYLESFRVVSHIPKFGDTSKSPAGDVGASLNCGICDTADKVGNYFSRLHLSSGAANNLSIGKSRRLDKSLNKVPVASI